MDFLVGERSNGAPRLLTLLRRTESSRKLVLNTESRLLVLCSDSRVRSKDSRPGSGVGCGSSDGTGEVKRTTFADDARPKGDGAGDNDRGTLEKDGSGFNSDF